MRYLECLFPIARYARRRRQVPLWRVRVAVGAAILVQWAVVNLIIAIDCSAHVPFRELIMHGLEDILFPVQFLLGHRGTHDMDTESTILKSIGMGFLVGALALEYIAAAVFLRRKQFSRSSHWARTLVKLVLLSCHTWMIYWTAYTLLWLLAGGLGRMESMVLMTFVIPGLLIIILTAQAVTATDRICSPHADRAPGA